LLRYCILFHADWCFAFLSLSHFVGKASCCTVL
jgi:hypothetical protein